MIVKMKKIELLLFYSERERFLKSLQQLGVVHIETTPEITSADLERAIELESRYERTIKALKGIKGSKTAKPRDGKMADPEVILDEFDEALKSLKQTTAELKELESVIKRLGPWGDFEPENIEKLGRAGLKGHFFEIPLKRFRSLDIEGLDCSVISRDKEKVYLVIFGKDESLRAILEEMRLPGVKLPSISLGRALDMEDDLKGKKMEILSAMERLAPYVGILSHARGRLEEDIRFKEAMLHMKEERGGKLLSVKGWISHDMEGELRSFLDEYSSYYEIKDAGADDRVPVLLKNNRFSRLFEPITRIFSLPSYFELDPTPFFAPFFAIFFGLCLADMGYGLILFTVMTIMAFKGALTLRPVFILGALLGALTIFGGLALNTFFGHAIFKLPGVEEGIFSSGAYLAPLGSFNEGGQTVFPAMQFALMLGFMQVMLGMTLQAINKTRRLGPVHGIQPLSYILMLTGGLVTAAQTDTMGMASLLIGPLPVGTWLHGAPSFMGNPAILAGLVLLFLFNNPDKKFFIRPALGLWELYGFVTGIMGDILSYLRLFALGLAGGLLGNAFNNIAFMFIRDSEGMEHYASFGIIFTILILIFGHTLNLGLAMLGGFVHSLRLTFVEFYKNLKFEGGSFPFKPLSIEGKDSHINN